MRDRYGDDADAAADGDAVDNKDGVHDLNDADG